MQAVPDCGLNGRYTEVLRFHQDMPIDRCATSRIINRAGAA